MRKPRMTCVENNDEIVLIAVVWIMMSLITSCYYSVVDYFA